MYASSSSRTKHHIPDVDSFGIVYIQSSGPAVHKIEAIDPVKYPDQQDICLDLSNDVKFELKDNRLLELDAMNNSEGAISTDIQVPMKYGICLIANCVIFKARAILKYFNIQMLLQRYRSLR